MSGFDLTGGLAALRSQFLSSSQQAGPSSEPHHHQHQHQHQQPSSSIDGPVISSSGSSFSTSAPRQTPQLPRLQTDFSSSATKTVPGVGSSFPPAQLNHNEREGRGGSSSSSGGGGGGGRTTDTGSQRGSADSYRSYSERSGPSTALTTPNASMEAKAASNGKWNQSSEPDRRDSSQSSNSVSIRGSNAAFAYSDHLLNTTSPLLSGTPSFSGPSTSTRSASGLLSPSMTNGSNAGLRASSSSSAAGSPGDEELMADLSIASASSSGATPTASADGKAAKKSNPLQDLIQTERAYVSELSTIIRKVAAAWNRSNMPPPELDIMFRNVESIYRVNKTFLRSLKEIGPEPSSPRALGDLLMHWIDDLEAPYSRYCENYFTDFDTWPVAQNNERLQSILADLTADSRSTEVFSDKKRQAGDDWTLDTLFGLPQIRLKYYKKLYARLLKSTNPGRSDHRLLVGANEKLDELMTKAKQRISMSILDDSPIARAQQMARQRDGEGRSKRAEHDVAPTPPSKTASTGTGTSTPTPTPTPSDLSRQASATSASSHSVPLRMMTPSDLSRQESGGSSSSSSGSRLAALQQRPSPLDLSRQATTNSSMISSSPAAASRVGPDSSRLTPSDLSRQTSTNSSSSSAGRVPTPTDGSRLATPQSAHVVGAPASPATLPQSSLMERLGDLDFGSFNGENTSSSPSTLFSPGMSAPPSTLFSPTSSASPSMLLSPPPPLMEHSDPGAQHEVAGGKKSPLPSSASAPVSASPELDRAQELERSLDVSRVLDIFTMQQKKCQLRINPPSLPFRRSLRRGADVTIAFRPLSSMQPVLWQRGHVFLLTDLFLVCERMTPSQRAERGAGSDGMWLLFPPLAGKHLQVMDTGRSDHTLAVTVLKKETLNMTFGSKEEKEAWIQAFADCHDFATQMQAQGANNSSPAMGPTSPQPQSQSLPHSQPLPQSQSQPGMVGRGPRPGQQPGAASAGGASMPSSRPQQPRPAFAGPPGQNRPGFRPPPGPGGSAQPTSSQPGFLNRPPPASHQQAYDRERRPQRQPSAPNLRAPSPATSNPPIRTRSTSSMSLGAPKLPSEMLRDGEIRHEGYSPPSSPKLKARGPTSSTVSAQMRCRLYLKQGHANWKSLGNARLKVYHLLPADQRQLVVENDKKMLISTIVLPDGVERVGKVGVAVEVSDAGNRTGIVYMLQMRSEESAQGLFGELIEGSGRTTAR